MERAQLATAIKYEAGGGLFNSLSGLAEAEGPSDTACPAPLGNKAFGAVRWSF